MDWLRHQCAVWTYGAQLLAILAAFGFVAACIGGLLLLPLIELTDFEFSGTAWAISTALVAPFFVPSVAESFADHVRRDPPPRFRPGKRRQPVQDTPTSEPVQANNFGGDLGASLRGTANPAEQHWHITNTPLPETTTPAPAPLILNLYEPPERSRPSLSLVENKPGEAR